MEDCGPRAWSCYECNKMLGDKIFSTFLERCHWVSSQYEKKALAINWHGWEIAQLGPTLRASVIHENTKRLMARKKADWYGSRHFWRQVEPLLYEKLDIKGISFFRSTIERVKQELYCEKEH